MGKDYNLHLNRMQGNSSHRHSVIGGFSCLKKAIKIKTGFKKLIYGIKHFFLINLVHLRINSLF